MGRTTLKVDLFVCRILMPIRKSGLRGTLLLLRLSGRKLRGRRKRLNRRKLRRPKESKKREEKEKLRRFELLMRSPSNLMSNL